MAGCFENLKAIFGENVSDSEIAAALKDIEEMKKAYGSDFMKKFNENTLAMPLFRTDMEAEIAKKLYNIANAFVGERSNAVHNDWGASFPRYFDMASDSDLFRETYNDGMVLQIGRASCRERVSSPV